MADIRQFNQYGENLQQYLELKTFPIALKFLRSEDEIPEGTLRPKRDRGYHLAQCQVFALNRREGLSIAMLKEDHWCWGPLVGYGLVDPAAAEKFVETREQMKVLPRLEYGSYIGLLSAPLKSAAFVPDLVLVYSNTAQLRKLLMALKFSGNGLLTSQFDPIDSCVFAVVPVLREGGFRITIPDPGEEERAGAEECEIILSVPAAKMEDLIKGLEVSRRFTLPAAIREVEMEPDFARPEFYTRLFKAWGLDSEQ